MRAGNDLAGKVKTIPSRRRTGRITVQHVAVMLVWSVGCAILFS